MSFFQKVKVNGVDVGTNFGGEPDSFNPSPWRECGSLEPDKACREKFRLEVAHNRITLYVNGVKYQENLMPDNSVPPEILNQNQYVYLSSVVQGLNANSTRFHWDRLAINPVAAPPKPKPASWTETFTNASGTPQAFRSANWNVSVHERDRAPGQLPAPLTADHGPGCQSPTSPPPTHQHPASTDAETVFLCNDHLMTTVRGESGYAVTYLMPNRTLELSDDPAATSEVSFDLSSFRSGDRQWVDVWITPPENQLAKPLQSFLPDLSGEPRRGIHVVMDSFAHKTSWRAYQFTEAGVFELNGSYWKTLEDVKPQDKAIRDKFVISLSKGRLKVSAPDVTPGGLTWVDAPLKEQLNWTSGIVQFGHHAYTPSKEGCGSPTQITNGVATDCTNTWHWDNITLNPSLPFTLINADVTQAFSNNGTVTFDQPAPEGAQLRASAIGQNLELSTDSGVTWRPMIQQRHRDITLNPYQERTYLTPIPAGALQIKFRGQDIANKSWRVSDPIVIAGS